MTRNVDLTTEVVMVDGRRLTEEDADQLADELSDRERAL
jgi:hypothetical protein